MIDPTHIFQGTNLNNQSSAGLGVQSWLDKIFSSSSWKRVKSEVKEVTTAEIDTNVKADKSLYVFVAFVGVLILILIGYGSKKKFRSR